MERQLVEPFLHFFSKFISLCQLDNWPNDDTTSKQIEDAFLVSQHIEKCRNKLTKKKIINEFTSELHKEIIVTSSLMKYCLSNPTRFILKKIITSSANINKMDEALLIFVAQFSEQKLEDYLSDIMLEVASKDTLFKYISTELSKSSQSEFKSQFLLSKLKCDDESVQIINEILQDSNQEVVDMLVVCLGSDNIKYKDAIRVVAEGFKNIMSSQNIVYKNFWKHLLRSEEDKFIQMCLNHDKIFYLICLALRDCGKLIQQSMTLKTYYVDLTYSELSSNVQKICKNDLLKQQFLQWSFDLTYKDNFWARMIQSS